MPRPHLCTLPAEVMGVIISEGMQGVITRVENRHGFGRFVLYQPRSRPVCAGLLWTCRLLREETFAYLGANIPLDIPSPHYFLCNPLAALSLAYKIKLQHLRITSDYCFDLSSDVENFPSLKTLHMDYKDWSVDTRLSNMFRNGDLTLADIVNHENLNILHDAVVKGHHRRLDLIIENIKERSWTLTTTLNCGPFEAELYPLQLDTDNNACEPIQVDKYQNQDDNDIEDNHSQGSQGTETDDSYDSDDTEVLRGLILVRHMPRSRGHTDGLQKAKVRETTDGVIRASLKANPDLIKIHQHDELGKVEYFEIDDVRVF